MAAPYGIEPFDSCLTCTWRKDRFFCNLDGDALKAFDAITFTTVYPAGSVLYAEGQSPRGAFMVCRGKVKLSATSSTGKTLITRIADEGEVLGMSSLLEDTLHRATAETLEPSQINFVRKDDFVKFVKDHGEACFHAAQQLARECQAADGHIRSLGLSQSAAEKLAYLLLGWVEERGKESEQGIRVSMLATHQEISQMIGSSRETVTRLLAEFRQKKIISTKGSTLVVLNKPALEQMVLL